MREGLLIKNSTLSVRAINALENAGFFSWDNCKKLNLRDLHQIKGIGKITADEIFNTIEVSRDSINSMEDSCISSEEHIDPEREKYLARALSIPILDVNLSVRATKILRNTQTKTIFDLVQKKPKEIITLRNCGKNTLVEITEFLKKLDLQFEMHISPSLLNKIRTYQQIKKREDILKEFEMIYPKKFKIFIGARLSRLPDSKIKFYMDCFEKYQEGGTLVYVAKIFGLTRERIRQILVKGTKLGLFKYTGYEYPFVERQKIIDAYSKSLSLTETAKLNKISPLYLKKLLTTYKITEEDLNVIRKNIRKEECIRAYKIMETKLGYHPKTTELYKGKGRYLLMRITKLWGSIDSFREAMKIPKPVRVFPEASRKWMEGRKRLAFVIRMQNLDEIRECLAKSGPLNTTVIAAECDMKSQKTFRLISLLLSRGEIIRQGIGSSTKYQIKESEAAR